MTTTRPRHAQKEVRQLADWLDDHGWKYTDVDSKGHSIWTWPPTGQTITLPETPRGTHWLKNTRITALKAMGQHQVTKRRPKEYTPSRPTPGLVVTRAHERQMLTWVQECRDELCAAATRNGNDSARRLFEVFARRLEQIITH
jgi:hypothetical protein